MSMPIIEKPENPIDRNQSVSDLIESVALMESGLSHIINAEGEKIQKIIKSDDPTAEVPIDDIINVNNSVERMVNTVSKLEMILQNKLDISKDLDQNGQPGPVIESSGAIIPYTGPIDASTLNNGSPNIGTILYQSDANIINVDLNGNADVVNWTSALPVYIIPRTGIITDFSVNFDLISASGAIIEKQLVARVYRADSDSTTFNAINEATIYFQPIPAGTTDDFKVSASVNNLNIEIEKDTKIFVIVYCLTETGVVSVRGTIAASINIT